MIPYQPPLLLSSCQNSVVTNVPSLFWEKRLQSFTSKTSNFGQFYVFPVQKRVDIMVISPSFDFMERFSQLCLVKSEKKQKRQDIWLYFGWNNQNKDKTKLFISPWKARNLALGKIKCRLGYLEVIRLHFEARIGFFAPNLGRKWP